MEQFWIYCLFNEPTFNNNKQVCGAYTNTHIMQLTHTVSVPQMKGVNVEAVLRVEENEEDGRKRKNVSRRREAEDDLGLSMLIDSQNNQYILTKPRDSTMPRADPHLIKVKPLSSHEVLVLP